LRGLFNTRDRFGFNKSLFLVSCLLFSLLFISFSYAFSNPSQTGEGCCYLTGGAAIECNSPLHKFYNASPLDSERVQRTELTHPNNFTSSNSYSCPELLDATYPLEIEPGCCILEKPNGDNVCVWFDSNVGNLGRYGGKLTCLSDFYYSDNVNDISIFKKLYDFRHIGGYTAKTSYNPSSVTSKDICIGGESYSNYVSYNCTSSLTKRLNLNITHNGIPVTTGVSIKILNVANNRLYVTPFEMGDGWYNFTVEENLNYLINVTSDSYNTNDTFVILANADKNVDVSLNSVEGKKVVTFRIEYNRKTNIASSEFMAPVQGDIFHTFYYSIDTAAAVSKDCFISEAEGGSAALTGELVNYTCEVLVDTGKSLKIENVTIGKNVYYDTTVFKGGVPVTISGTTYIIGSIDADIIVKIKFAAKDVQKVIGEVKKTAGTIISENVSIYGVHQYGTSGKCDLDKIMTGDSSFLGGIISNQYIDDPNMNGHYSLYFPEGSSYCLYVNQDPKYKSGVAGADGDVKEEPADADTFDPFLIQGATTPKVIDLQLEDAIFSASVHVEYSDTHTCAGIICYVYKGNDKVDAYPNGVDPDDVDCDCGFENFAFSENGYRVISTNPQNKNYWVAYNYTSGLGAGTLSFDQVLEKKNYISKTSFVMAFNGSCLKEEGINYDTATNNLWVASALATTCILSNASVSILSMDNRSYPQEYVNDMTVCNTSSKFIFTLPTTYGGGSFTEYACKIENSIENTDWLSETIEKGNISRYLEVRTSDSFTTKSIYWNFSNTTQNDNFIIAVMDDLPFGSCSSRPSVELTKILPIPGTKSMEVHWSTAYYDPCGAEEYEIQVLVPKQQTTPDKVVFGKESITIDCRKSGSTDSCHFSSSEIIANFTLLNWDIDYRICVRAKYKQFGWSNCNISYDAIDYSDCKEQCGSLDRSKGGVNYGTCESPNPYPADDTASGYYYCANAGNAICGEYFATGSQEFCEGDIIKSEWYYQKSSSVAIPNLFIYSSGTLATNNLEAKKIYNNVVRTKAEQIKFDTPDCKNADGTIKNEQYCLSFFESDLVMGRNYRYYCNQYNRVVGAPDYDLKDDGQVIYPFNCSEYGRTKTTVFDPLDSMVCVKAKKGKTICVLEKDCPYEQMQDTFGLFYSNKSCSFKLDTDGLIAKDGGEPIKLYCKYEKSFSNFGNAEDKNHKDTFTATDECMNCDPIGSCSDYKSKNSCLSDNCNYLNCTWSDTTFAGLGFGVCKSAISQESKCNLCFKTDNEYLDACDKNKCEALGPSASLSSYGCYWDSDVFMSNLTRANMGLDGDNAPEYQLYYSNYDATSDIVRKGAFDHACRYCNELNCYDVDNISTYTNYLFNNYTNVISSQVVDQKTCKFYSCRNISDAKLVKDGNGNGLDDCTPTDNIFLNISADSGTCDPAKYLEYVKSCQGDMIAPTSRISQSATFTEKSIFSIYSQDPFQNVNSEDENRMLLNDNLKEQFVTDLIYGCIDVNNSCDPNNNTEFYGAENIPNKNNCWKYDCFDYVETVDYDECYLDEYHFSVSSRQLTEYGYPKSCYEICRPYISTCPLEDNNTMPFYFIVNFTKVKTKTAMRLSSNPLYDPFIYGVKLFDNTDKENSYLKTEYDSVVTHFANITREGINYVRFFGVDKNNNYETVKSTKIRVDTYGPVIKIDVNASPNKFGGHGIFACDEDGDENLDDDETDRFVQIGSNYLNITDTGITREAATCTGNKWIYVDNRGWIDFNVTINEPNMPCTLKLTKSVLTQYKYVFSFLSKRTQYFNTTFLYGCEGQGCSDSPFEDPDNDIYQIFNHFAITQGGYNITVTCTDDNGNVGEATAGFFVDGNVNINDETYISNHTVQPSPVTKVYLDKTVKKPSDAEYNVFDVLNEPCQNYDTPGCSFPPFSSGGPKRIILPFSNLNFTFTTLLNASCKVNYTTIDGSSDIKSWPLNANLYIINDSTATKHTIVGLPAKNATFVLNCTYGDVGQKTKMTYTYWIDNSVPNTTLLIMNLAGSYGKYVNGEWYGPLVPYTPLDFSFSLFDNPIKNVTTKHNMYCINYTNPICSNYTKHEGVRDVKKLIQSGYICYQSFDYGNYTEAQKCSQVQVDNVPPILVIDYQNITNQNEMNVTGYVLDFHHFAKYSILTPMFLPANEGAGTIAELEGKFTPAINTSMFDGRGYTHYAYGVSFYGFSSKDINTGGAYADFIFSKTPSGYYAVRVNNTKSTYFNSGSGLTVISHNENIQVIFYNASSSTYTPLAKKEMPGGFEQGYILVYNNPFDLKYEVRIYSLDTYTGIESSKIMDLKHNLILRYNFSESQLDPGDFGVKSYNAVFNLDNLGYADLSDYFDNVLRFKYSSSQTPYNYTSANVTFSIPVKLNSIVNNLYSIYAEDKVGYNNTYKKETDNLFEIGHAFEGGGIVIDQAAPNVTSLIDAQHSVDYATCLGKPVSDLYDCDMQRKHIQFMEDFKMQLEIGDCTGKISDQKCGEVIIPGTGTAIRRAFQMSSGVKGFNLQISDYEGTSVYNNNFVYGSSGLLVVTNSSSDYGLDSNFGKVKYQFDVFPLAFTNPIYLNKNFTFYITPFDNFDNGLSSNTRIYEEKIPLIDMGVPALSINITNVKTIKNHFNSLSLLPLDSNKYTRNCFNAIVNLTRNVSLISDFKIKVGNNPTSMDVLVYMGYGCTGNNDTFNGGLSNYDAFHDGTPVQLSFKFKDEGIDLTYPCYLLYPYPNPSNPSCSDRYTPYNSNLISFDVTLRARESGIYGHHTGLIREHSLESDPLYPDYAYRVYNGIPESPTIEHPTNLFVHTQNIVISGYVSGKGDENVSINTTNVNSGIINIHGTLSGTSDVRSQILINTSSNVSINEHKLGFNVASNLASKTIGGGLTITANDTNFAGSKGNVISIRIDDATVTVPEINMIGSMMIVKINSTTSSFSDLKSVLSSSPLSSIITVSGVGSTVKLDTIFSGGNYPRTYLTGGNDYNGKTAFKEYFFSDATRVTANLSVGADDLVLTSKLPGVLGNKISLEIIEGASSVVVDSINFKITLTIPITSEYSDVATAINGDQIANKLVIATGTTADAAILPQTHLTGGIDKGYFALTSKVQGALGNNIALIIKDEPQNFIGTVQVSNSKITVRRNLTGVTGKEIADMINQEPLANGLVTAYGTNVSITEILETSLLGGAEITLTANELVNSIFNVGNGISSVLDSSTGKINISNSGEYVSGIRITGTNNVTFKTVLGLSGTTANYPTIGQASSTTYVYTKNMNDLLVGPPKILSTTISKNVVKGSSTVCLTSATFGGKYIDLTSNHMSVTESDYQYVRLSHDTGNCYTMSRPALANINSGTPVFLYTDGEYKYGNFYLPVVLEKGNNIFNFSTVDAVGFKGQPKSITMFYNDIQPMIVRKNPNDYDYSTGSNKTKLIYEVSISSATEITLNSFIVNITNSTGETVAYCDASLPSCTVGAPNFVMKKENAGLSSNTTRFIINNSKGFFDGVYNINVTAIDNSDYVQTSRNILRINSALADDFDYFNITGNLTTPLWFNNNSYFVKYHLNPNSTNGSFNVIVGFDGKSKYNLSLGYSFIGSINGVYNESLSLSGYQFVNFSVNIGLPIADGQYNLSFNISKNITSIYYGEPRNIFIPIYFDSSKPNVSTSVYKILDSLTSRTKLEYCQNGTVRGIVTDSSGIKSITYNITQGEKTLTGTTLKIPVINDSSATSITFDISIPIISLDGICYFEDSQGGSDIIPFYGQFEINYFVNDSLTNRGIVRNLITVEDLEAPIITISNQHVETTEENGGMSTFYVRPDYALNVSTNENATCSLIYTYFNGLMTRVTNVSHYYNFSLATPLIDGTSYILNVSCQDNHNHVNSTKFKMEVDGTRISILGLELSGENVNNVKSYRDGNYIIRYISNPSSPDALEVVLDVKLSEKGNCVYNITNRHTRSLIRTGNFGTEYLENFNQDIRQGLSDKTNYSITVFCKDRANYDTFLNVNLSIDTDINGWPKLNITIDADVVSTLTSTRKIIVPGKKYLMHIVSETPLSVIRNISFVVDGMNHDLVFTNITGDTITDIPITPQNNILVNVTFYDYGKNFDTLLTMYADMIGSNGFYGTVVNLKGGDYYYYTKYIHRPVMINPLKMYSVVNKNDIMFAGITEPKGENYNVTMNVSATGKLLSDFTSAENILKYSTNAYSVLESKSKGSTSVCIRYSEGSPANLISHNNKYISFGDSHDAFNNYTYYQITNVGAQCGELLLSTRLITITPSLQSDVLATQNAYLYDLKEKTNYFYIPINLSILNDWNNYTLWSYDELKRKGVIFEYRYLYYNTIAPLFLSASLEDFVATSSKDHDVEYLINISNEKVINLSKIIFNVTKTKEGVTSTYSYCTLNTIINGNNNCGSDKLFITKSNKEYDVSFVPTTVFDDAYYFFNIFFEDNSGMSLVYNHSLDVNSLYPSDGNLSVVGTNNIFTTPVSPNKPELHLNLNSNFILNISFKDDDNNYSVKSDYYLCKLNQSANKCNVVSSAIISKRDGNNTGLLGYIEFSIDKTLLSEGRYQIWYNISKNISSSPIVFGIGAMKNSMFVVDISQPNVEMYNKTTYIDTDIDVVVSQLQYCSNATINLNVDDHSGINDTINLKIYANTIFITERNLSVSDVVYENSIHSERMIKIPLNVKQIGDYCYLNDTNSIDSQKNFFGNISFNISVSDKLMNKGDRQVSFDVKDTSTMSIFLKGKEGSEYLTSGLYYVYINSTYKLSAVTSQKAKCTFEWTAKIPPTFTPFDDSTSYNLEHYYTSGGLFLTNGVGYYLNLNCTNQNGVSTLKKFYTFVDNSQLVIDLVNITGKNVVNTAAGKYKISTLFDKIPDVREYYLSLKLSKVAECYLNLSETSINKKYSYYFTGEANSFISDSLVELSPTLLSNETVNINVFCKDKVGNEKTLSVQLVLDIDEDITLPEATIKMYRTDALETYSLGPYPPSSYYFVINVTGETNISEINIRNSLNNVIKNYVTTYKNNNLSKNGNFVYVYPFTVGTFIPPEDQSNEYMKFYFDVYDKARNKGTFNMTVYVDLAPPQITLNSYKASLMKNRRGIWYTSFDDVYINGQGINNDLFYVYENNTPSDKIYSIKSSSLLASTPLLKALRGDDEVLVYPITTNGFDLNRLLDNSSYLAFGYDGECSDIPLLSPRDYNDFYTIVGYESVSTDTLVIFVNESLELYTSELSKTTSARRNNYVCIYDKPASNNYFKFKVSVPKDEPVTYKVHPVDEAGNIGPAQTISFMYDVGNPQITNKYPNNNDVFSEKNLDLELRIINASFVTNVTFNVDGTIYTETCDILKSDYTKNGICYVSLSLMNLVDGDYSVSILVNYEEMEYPVSDTLHFIIDSSVPSRPVFSISGKTFEIIRDSYCINNLSSVSANYKQDEIITNVSSNINGSAFVLLMSNVLNNYTSGILADENLLYRFNTTATKQTTNTNNLFILYDSSAPVITETVKYSTQRIGFVFDVDVSDMCQASSLKVYMTDDTGRVCLDNISIPVKTSSAFFGFYLSSRNVEPLISSGCYVKEGNYSVTYTISDVLSNTNQFTEKYVIEDVDPPQIEDVTPRSAASVVGGLNYYVKINQKFIDINVRTDEPSDCVLNYQSRSTSFLTFDGMSHTLNIEELEFETSRQHLIYTISCADRSTAKHVSEDVKYDIEYDLDAPQIFFSITPVMDVLGKSYVTGEYLQSDLRVTSFEEPIMCKFYRVDQTLLETYSFGTSNISTKWNNYDDLVKGVRRDILAIVPNTVQLIPLMLEGTISPLINYEAQRLIDKHDYIYYVICKDEANNFVSLESTVAFSTDRSKILTIYDVLPRYDISTMIGYTNDENYNLSFKTAKVANCSIRVKDTLIPLGVSSQFSIKPGKLSNNPRGTAITINCADNSTVGKVEPASKSFTLILDIKHPTFTITKPINGEKFTTTSTKIMGSVSEAPATESEQGPMLSIYRNGVLSQLPYQIRDMTIDEVLYLIEGENNFTFTISDAAGNSDSIDRKVTSEITSVCYDCNGDRICDFSTPTDIGGGKCEYLGAFGEFVNGRCIITDNKCTILNIEEPKVKTVSVFNGDILRKLDNVFVEFTDNSGVLNISLTKIELLNIDTNQLIPISQINEINSIKAELRLFGVTDGNYMLTIIPVKRDNTYGLVGNPIQFQIRSNVPMIDYDLENGVKVTSKLRNNKIIGNVSCVSDCCVGYCNPSYGLASMFFNNTIFRSEIMVGYMEDGRFGLNYGYSGVYLYRNGTVTENLFTANITDRDLRKGSKSLVVYQDDKAPSITLVSPKDGYSKDKNPTIALLTDEVAICGYSLNYSSDFGRYSYFDPRNGSTYHTIKTLGLNLDIVKDLNIYVKCRDAKVLTQITDLAFTLHYDNLSLLKTNITVTLEKEDVLDPEYIYINEIAVPILTNKIFVTSEKDVSCNLYGDVLVYTDNYEKNLMFELSNLEDQRTYNIKVVCIDKAQTTPMMFDISFDVNTGASLEIKEIYVEKAVFTSGTSYVNNNTFVIVAKTNREADCAVYDVLTHKQNNPIFGNLFDLNYNDIVTQEEGYGTIYFSIPITDFKTHKQLISKSGNYANLPLEYQFACVLHQPGKEAEQKYGEEYKLSFTLDNVLPKVTFNVLKDKPIRAGMLPLEMSFDDDPDLFYPHNKNITIYVDQKGDIDETGKVDCVPNENTCSYNYLVMKDDNPSFDDYDYIDGNATIILSGAKDRAGNEPVYINNVFEIETMALKPVYNVFPNGNYNPDCMEFITIKFDNYANITSLKLKREIDSYFSDIMDLLVANDSGKLFTVALKDSKFVRDETKYGNYKLELKFKDIYGRNGSDIIEFNFQDTICPANEPKLKFVYSYANVNLLTKQVSFVPLFGEVDLSDFETPIIPVNYANFTSLFFYKPQGDSVTNIGMTFEMDDDFRTRNSYIGNEVGEFNVPLSNLYNGLHVVYYNVTGEYPLGSGIKYSAGPFVRTFGVDTIAPNPKFYSKSRQLAYIEIR
jgi:hypothetical protein